MDDREALKNWFSEYHGELLRFMTACAGDHHTACDIVQETYVRAYLKFHLFAPEKGRLKNWIFKMAVNLFRDHLRSKRREDDFLRDYALAASLEASPEDDKGGEPEATPEEIREALAAVDPGKRAIILLSVENGTDDIAEMLSIPPGTVKSRLHYARRALIGKIREIKGVR